MQIAESARKEEPLFVFVCLIQVRGGLLTLKFFPTPIALIKLLNSCKLTCERPTSIRSGRSFFI